MDPLLRPSASLLDEDAASVASSSTSTAKKSAGGLSSASSKKKGAAGTSSVKSVFDLDGPSKKSSAMFNLLMGDDDAEGADSSEEEEADVKATPKKKGSSKEKGGSAKPKTGKKKSKGKEGPDDNSSLSLEALLSQKTSLAPPASASTSLPTPSPSPQSQPTAPVSSTPTPVLNPFLAKPPSNTPPAPVPIHKPAMSLAPKPPTASTAATAASPIATAAAGLDGVIAALRELVAWPITYAHEASVLGVHFPRGLLLHGPPGTGKSLAVRVIAEETSSNVVTVTAATIMGAFTGESERRLRECFAQAERLSVESGRPSIVFLDELDALCPKREGQKQHEARVVAQLLTLMDGASRARGGHVVVVGATNRPGSIDAALRRPGRFDREIPVPVPGPTERAAILQLHCKSLPLHPSCDLAKIAADLHGYTGADLAALAREAAMEALARDLLRAAEGPAGSDSESQVTAHDFAAACARVRPSVVRGSEVEVRPVAWDDIGGIPEVKERLRQAVEWPLKHRAAFERLGLAAPKGVLLYGPPGCSKTTLVRALATSSGLSVIPLGCTQLYSMYVGEGEENLRDAFRRARLAAPSLLFLDEIDALAPKREEGGGGGADVGTRLLSALLTEMDGLEGATGVIVVGATNRPQALDSALLRPGRLDVQVYVPPPDREGRLQVLQVHARSLALDPAVDLTGIAGATEEFTGAELQSLCREAAFAALRSASTTVRQEHFMAALKEMSPACTKDVLRSFERFRSGR